ncbi:MAG: 2-C-methyl-D-erythritol 2,4-cyclodiphosphate synthase [Chloroflexi bacterium]|nr:2-C-methyl-D-erythritol 2,4-cyclodiphosphate synthase [Chloroflexota bacterium]
MTETTLDVIILSAGKSSRMNGIDKQLYKISNKNVITYSIELFNQIEETRSITVMLSEDNINQVKNIIKNLELNKDIYTLIGGSRRQDTVKLALKNLSSIYSNLEIIGVHDGARPFATKKIITNGIKSVHVTGASIPVIPISDTVKKISNNLVSKTYDRKKLGSVQTPQFFKFDVLNTSYELLDSEITDDASAVELSGGLVSTFPGSSENIKITNPIDLQLANSILEKKGQFIYNNISNQIRYGIGFDCHKLIEGGPLRLGGIDIPFEKKLAGHSDGDVLLHSIASSILGAAELGDLGGNFPSNDEKFKNLHSEYFINESIRLLNEKGWKIIYIDSTIIAEKPRLGSSVELIIDSLSKISSLRNIKINLKITSTDSVGLIGKSEGIAAQSIATISKI